jgi:hypothetical protein
MRVPALLVVVSRQFAATADGRLRPCFSARLN